MNKNRSIANRIADDLFENHDHEVAERLVLTGKNGEDLGGWCKKAVVERVLLVLKSETFKEGK